MQLRGGGRLCLLSKSRIISEVKKHKSVTNKKNNKK